MKIIIIYLVLVMLVSCTKSDNTKTSVEPTNPPVKVQEKKSQSKYPCKTNCAPVDKKICENLLKEYSKCESFKNQPKCRGFVTIFAQALPRTVECTNSCSEKPFKMPITFSCDDIDPKAYPKITERSAHLLSELKFSEARKLFLSNSFEGILDGALAEDIRPGLEKTRAEKKKATPTE